MISHLKIFNPSDWIALSSLVIALISLVISLLTDYKLKKQQLIINESTLKKIEEEKILKSKAFVSIEKGMEGEPFGWTLIIKNNGLGDAKNIRIKCKSMQSISEFNKKYNILPCHFLSSGEQIKFEIPYYYNDPTGPINFHIMWDDEYLTNNQKIEVLSF